MPLRSKTTRVTMITLALLTMGLLAAPTAWAEVAVAGTVEDAADDGIPSLDETEGARWDAFKTWVHNKMKEIASRLY